MLHSPLARCLAATLSLGAAVPVLPAQLAVTGVSPARHALDAPTSATIAVDFDAPVARASVSASSFRVFGRWSGVTPGALSFANGDRRVLFAPSRPFFPGETVIVSLSSVVTSAGGAALAGGHSFSFWTRPGRGSAAFSLVSGMPVRRPGEGPVRTYGAYAGDLDGDGAPDLSMPNELSHDVRVMRNDGCGTYAMTSRHPVAPNGQPSANEGGDFNGDGVMDLAVANILAGAMTILLGDGHGGYLPGTSYPAAADTRGVAVLDVDGDGDDDVVTSHRQASTLALHRNRGDGTFAPAVQFNGGSGERGLAAADANADGIVDLFVGNYNDNTLTLLLGNGSGGFAASASVAVPSGPWMVVTGDVDGDGAVDAAVCCAGAGRMAIVRGDGAGGLHAAQPSNTGSFPLAIEVGDLDGDADLDVVVSNFSSASFTVLFNRGDGTFASPTTLNAPEAGSCALVVDYDRDGDMDIVGIDELADVVLLFRQQGPAPAGVQPPLCGASLRVDSLAMRAGFGGRPAHPITRGASLFVGVTGAPSQLWAALVGAANLEPGLVLPFGLFNLGTVPPAQLASGATDPFGEARLQLAVPATLAAGVSVTLQGTVTDPSAPSGIRLTNPEQLITQ